MASSKRLEPMTSQVRKNTQTEQGGTRCLISLNYNNLLLLFILGSIAGLIIEIVFHLVVYGEFQNRAGLIWGPFSPLYGFGVIAFTVILNWFWRCPGLIIFLASAVLGSIVEFVCSWWMEHTFGAIAWDYSGTFLDIEGRVNLASALIWGAMGFLWVRFAMPAMSRGFEQINWEKPTLKFASIFLTVLLLANITLTVQAFARESQRAIGLPATTSYERFLDENFSSAWMASHFENLTIYGIKN